MVNFFYFFLIKVRSIGIIVTSMLHIFIIIIIIIYSLFTRFLHQC